jgi:hypothetical protein
LGIVGGIWFDPFWIRALLGVVGATVFLLGSASALSEYYRLRDIPDPALNVLGVMLLFGIPLAGFGLLPSAPVSDGDAWGLALMVALALGLLSGFFSDDRTDKDSSYF